MPVKQFFAHAGLFLHRGDILLSRSPTFASRMIRFFSASFFSHAAMVFLLPKEKEGFTNTFVIESLFRGVGVADLATYVEGRKPVEEVGILRLKGDAFTADFFKKTNGFLLNEVNQPYDFHRLFRIAWTIIFGMHQAVRKIARRPNVYRRWMPRQFICSGFIQYGLFRAAESSGLDPNHVMLKNGLSNPTKDEMLGVTPEDVATSDRLTWKYAIRRGWVYEVASYEAARKIISGARS